ncbi:MAG: SRPBCC family protein [Chroococcidiopsidaceae cyanobacterium CP_BM_ER_R8_30]|nr:SRPBCC family protein [Chroococcidiopsidaceae cyanobacterium CP_BM_ER_R8_30]
MLHFKYSTLIYAPVEVVWDFHEQPDILELLTPPWQPIEVARREGGLEVGAISEFRIFVGPISLRWIAVHTEYEKYRLFTDEQKEGPFAYWRHRHEFTKVEDKTRLTDEIEFALPGGESVDFLGGWFVSMQLDRMFCYRHEVTQRECHQQRRGTWR